MSWRAILTEEGVASEVREIRRAGDQVRGKRGAPDARWIGARRMRAGLGRAGCALDFGALKLR